MSITIKEAGTPAPPATPKQRIDIQDSALTLGFLLLEAGTALVYIPAALILAGFLFIVSAGLIQASRITGKK
jgi:hypothetical protein